MRRGVKYLLIVALAAGATCALWWFWYSNRNYGAVFLQQAGNLAEQTSTLRATGEISAVFDVFLRSDTGLKVDAAMREPLRVGKFQGVLLVVGVETGKRVIDLIDETDKLVVLAVDYGWGEEFDITTFPMLCRTLSRLRKVSLDSVPRLLLGLEFLARHPKVDASRIVVVGVSYGTYQALPAAVLDSRVSKLVLVQGGGELGQTVAANVERWEAPLSPGLAARVARVLFLPLQPERWVTKLAPRPVTFIASRTDPTLPVAAVEQTYAMAGPNKELAWHDTPHVEPGAAEIIAELSGVVLARLGATD